MNRAGHIELSELVILLLLSVPPRPQQLSIRAGAQPGAFLTVLGKEDTQGPDWDPGPQERL